MQPVHTLPVNSEVLEGLHDIRTTPYSSSFLSRLRGFQPTLQESILAVDWDNVTPWMDLMNDIREHYTFMQWVFSDFPSARQLRLKLLQPGPRAGY